MNNRYSHVLGIDVSKRRLDVALLHAGKLRSKVVDNTSQGHSDLQIWLTTQGVSPGSTHVCLEATGPYGEAVALALADAGWSVSVVNPSRVKGFAQSELNRNKTDRADAALLARFCAALQPDIWEPPAPAWRELRAKVDRLQTLKEIHQQECNRLEAHRTVRATALIADIQEHLDWLERKMAVLIADIDDHIDHHPQLKEDAKLIESIPGIGKTTVAKVLAYLGDVRRFRSAKALAAFVGVSPRERRSGSSVRGRTMLSRAGHAAMRRALYMPGLVALRHNPVLKDFGERLRASGLAPKAVVGAAMRKLVHLIYGVIRSGQQFNPQFGKLALDCQDGI